MLRNKMPGLAMNGGMYLKRIKSLYGRGGADYYQGYELKIRTVPRPDKPLQVLLKRLNLKLQERMTKRVL
jgi:hypothetical protein